MYGPRTEILHNIDPTTGNTSALRLGDYKLLVKVPNVSDLRLSYCFACLTVPVLNSLADKCAPALLNVVSGLVPVPSRLVLQ